MTPSSPAKNSLPVSRSWPGGKVLYGSCSQQKCLQEGSKNSLNARDSFCKSEKSWQFSFDNLTKESLFTSFKYHRTATMSSKSTRHSLFPPGRTFTGSSTISQSSYMPNPMSQILPHLYLGSIYNADNEAQLNEKGITHILSLDSKSLAALENTKHFPMCDRGRTSLKEVLDKVQTFIVEGQKDGNTILIHCHLGQNRSAAVVIAFLMINAKYKNNPYTLYQAHKKVKAARPLILIHREYAKQLLELEKELRGMNSLPQNWMEQEPFNKRTGELRFKHASLDSDAQRNFVRGCDL